MLDPNKKWVMVRETGDGVSVEYPAGVEDIRAVGMLEVAKAIIIGSKGQGRSSAVPFLRGNGH